jgi:hypothetical protein
MGSLGHLESFGNRLKVQDYAKRNTRQGDEGNLSTPTAGADGRTDDCAGGADHLHAGQTSNFDVFKMAVKSVWRKLSCENSIA